MLRIKLHVPAKITPAERAIDFIVDDSSYTDAIYCDRLSTRSRTDSNEPAMLMKNLVCVRVGSAACAWMAEINWEEKVMNEQLGK